jgi:hypothetical protein
MAGLMAGSPLDELLLSDVEQVRAAVARSRVAGACGDHHDGQSQDPYSSGVPAGAEHADRTLRSVVSRLHARL